MRGLYLTRACSKVLVHCLRDDTPSSAARAVVPYVGLAEGKSTYIVRELTEHLEMNIWLPARATYREFRSDATKCEIALLLLKEEAQRDLLKGSITEEQLTLIEKRIDEHLDEIRKLLNSNNV